MRLRVVAHLVLSMLLPGLATAQTPVSGAAAASDGPAGRWATVNDSTGKADSVVAIWEENGMFYGRVEKLIDPDPKDPDPACAKCEGDLKNKPVQGMRILWDLKRSGEGWSGGTILDPNNGKTYRCSLSLAEGGKKLKVRGYLGFSLFGRTETWIREK